MATHRFLIQGRQYEVQVGARVGGTVHVTVNGKPYIVGLVATSPSVAPAQPTAQPTARPAAPAGGLSQPPPAAAGAPARAPAAAPPRTAPAASGAPGEVRAPIPGVVLAVAVAPGDRVSADTKLLVLEAMKMENEIFAGVGGVVAAVHVEPQQDVRQGDLLVTITAG